MKGRTIGGLDTEVTVYRGEDIIAFGTIRECAKKLGVQPGTIYFYLMPSYQARIAKRKNSDPSRVRQVVLS